MKKKEAQEPLRTFPVPLEMSVPFAEANDETMSLLGLLMKAAALPATMDLAAQTRILEVATRRSCTEPIANIPDSIKFKLIDKIMQVAPQLCVRPVADVAPPMATAHATAPALSLMVVVDTSGSMRSTIAAVQAALKAWIDQAMRDGGYGNVCIVLFDDKLYGPFRSTACLGQVHGSGTTRALPALRQLREELQHAGPSHVVFVTDGEFDEKKAAYDVGVLPNVVAFALVFPGHTPANAEAVHYAYLPRVTPAGIPITSRRAVSPSDMADLLEGAFTSTRRSGLATVQPLLYRLICGEYVMLAEMSLFQMNKIVADLLQSLDYSLVHKFFSHLIGMYHLMMHRSGDLLNSLRSPDMRLMWSFLQPLKKRLAQVAADEVHGATTALVLDFLAGFEASVVDLRDARLAVLRTSSSPNMSDAAKAEMAELLRAFSDMKKVDERDRIATEHLRLKKAATATATAVPPPAVRCVRFNHIAAVPLESFVCYPNNSKKDQAEIFQMMASIGLCSADDAGAVEVVMEPKGVLLVLRLLPYRAEHDVRMTLTATQATRLALGFYASQMAGQGAMYTCADDHIPVRALLLRLATVGHSPAILSNVTNMAESVNHSGEWIRVLATVARTACVRSAVQPQDLTLWRKEAAGQDDMPDPSGQNRTRMDDAAVAAASVGTAVSYVLDPTVLQRIADRDAALCIARNFNTSERQARVTRAIPIPIPNWAALIVVKTQAEQSSDEWFDEPVATVTIGRTALAVTNGMLLQEHVTQNARAFAARHWLSGHRLILKTGAAHPAAVYGDATNVRPAVEAWVRAAWAAVVGEAAAWDVPLPVVGSASQRADIAALFAARAAAQPVVYLKDLMEVCPVAAILDRMPPSRGAAVCRTLFATDDTFLKLAGDEQERLATAAAATLAMAPGEAPRHVASAPLQAEALEAAAALLAQRLTLRMAPLSVVAGVGVSRARRLLSQADWHALEDSCALRRADAPAPFDDSDFTCPLSSELFQDPVCFGGHMYERWMLERWLSGDPRRSSPLTRETHDAAGNPLQLEAPSAFFVAQLHMRRMREEA